MLLTVFLAIVFCAAITLMLISAVAFIQDKKFFSSAPKEAREVIQPRDKELFYGARVIGRTLMIFSFLMIAGVGIISIWDGFRNEYDFWQKRDVKALNSGKRKDEFMLLLFLCLLL